MEKITIALAGNPNCGKTTVFNALTGSSQYVGNWPGVTVEKKEGKLKGHRHVMIQDLPGIYSLSPYTLEEVVTREYLLKEQPDIILNIVDGSNLERNLYLTTQLLELGIPVVVAINMMDIVSKRGDVLYIEKLASHLHCTVVEMSALKGNGLMEAAQCAIDIVSKKLKISLPSLFHGPVEHTIAHIEESIDHVVKPQNIRWYAIKLFEHDEKAMNELSLSQEVREHLEAHIQECEGEMEDDSESIITNQRYAYISEMMQHCMKRNTANEELHTSDKIDQIITNRVLALPIFVVVMIVIYYISITSVGAYLTDFTNDVLFGEWILPTLTTMLEQWSVAPWLVSLLSDGIIGGVGAVLGFVPQMLLLFLMLSLLEDCGYMARVAFIMDRIFRRFGLSGKSFIPMLIGSGCSVPGIMASRTIEHIRDRRMTIMTTSFIPCGAKMPIVGFIAGAMFGGAWWVAPSAYFIGVAAIIVSGILLKKMRMFSGEPAPFIMELPSYHMPVPINILRSTWERGFSFIRRAGTVILLASILIWFLSGFGFVNGSFAMVEDMNHSILAAIGNWIAPIFAPLGFGNWQSTVATLMGLVAKEEVVGVFGVLFGVQGDALGLVESGSYASLHAIAVHFTTLSAFSFLIFNLLCAPCFAAMGAIKREMNHPKWTAFAIGYLCVFAYSIALMVYQFGLFFTGHGFTLWTGIAFGVFVFVLYLLVRKPYVEKDMVAPHVVAQEG